jgi:hypothetical protein
MIRAITMVIYCLISILSCGENFEWNAQAHEDAKRASSLYAEIRQCILTRKDAPSSNYPALKSVESYLFGKP